MDAALARMVMPRSRSWSLLSMTRSTTAWWAANVPVARSSASTSVVLPWSTCATKATFRNEGGMAPYRTVCGLASCRGPDAAEADVGQRRGALDRVVVIVVVIERDA